MNEIISVIGPLADALAQQVADHPERSITVVGAAAAALFNYQKTGNFPIGRLPYRAFRDGIREYRDRYFGVRRPKGVPAIVIDAGHDEIEDALRSRHFESGGLSSYEYDGEVLNLRRPSGVMNDPDTGENTPMETHLRTFSTESKRTLLLAHDEANRYEATGRHLREGDLFSWSRGRDILVDLLEDTDLDFDTIESERSAEVAVTSD